MPTSVAWTIGAIARELNQPVHRIEYVINSRRMQPAQRVGNLRVFTDSDVQFIAAEVRRIEAEKAGGGIR